MQVSSMHPGGENQPEAGLEQEAGTPALLQASYGSLFTAQPITVREDMLTGERTWNYPHSIQRERNCKKTVMKKTVMISGRGVGWGGEVWGGYHWLVHCHLTTPSSRQTPQ